MTQIQIAGLKNLIIQTEQEDIPLPSQLEILFTLEQDLQTTDIQMIFGSWILATDYKLVM